MSNKRRYGLRGRAPRSKQQSRSYPVGAHRPGAREAESSPSQPGDLNGYACPECDKVMIVMHRDAGVTPMFLACRMTEGCTGQSYSLGYPPNPPERVRNAVSHIWYRPSKKAFDAMDKPMQDHISRGGLVLIKLGEEFED